MLLDVARPVLPGERWGALLEAVSSLLMVAVKMCYASSILFVRNYGILDAHILDRWWYLRLETASRTVSAGKEVRRMKTYEVRVFVPTVYAIEANDDAEVLEKVGALYKELYTKDFRTLVAPLPEPEDCA